MAYLKNILAQDKKKALLIGFKQDHILSLKKLNAVRLKIKFLNGKLILSYSMMDQMKIIPLNLNHWHNNQPIMINTDSIWLMTKNVQLNMGSLKPHKWYLLRISMRESYHLLE